MNMSINIEITGIYSTYPDKTVRRSLIRNIKSLFGNSILNIIAVQIVNPAIAYDIYIYI